MLTTTGLAQASVRARPTALLGAFTAMVFSATVVAASVMIAGSAAVAPAGAKRTELTDIGTTFALITVYLSIFVVGQTMSLAVAQRDRENALLRAIGAGPWQLRRAVATEALCTAVAALPVGYVLGMGLARVWWDGMAGQGMVPDGVHLTFGTGPAWAAAGVLVLSSQLGGLLAARRAARAR
ncbi:ABC transporter permease, partial [Streptomyces sp. T-3]|nr:ABC transporter permease [Streptomyces sp. T-3]